jgi:hypothetical protein
MCGHPPTTFRRGILTVTLFKNSRFGQSHRLNLEFLICVIIDTISQMAQTKLFKLISLLLIIIAVLFFIDINFYLSWIFWWYDMVLHFLAGVIIGLSTIIIFHKAFDSGIMYYFKLVLMAVITAFLIGMLWEILELNLNLTSFSDGVAYITDTVSDLILDMFGALVGVLYGIEIWKKN